MKPVELKIQGLNSFYDLQTIDFSLLIKDGLFGIVGPTGAGKTSVVDAVTLALYGRIARYDGESDKMCQCVSAGESKMRVSFSFALTDFSGGAVYTAERGYERSGDSLRAVFARLIRHKPGNDPDIIADMPSRVTPEIVALTGLNYQDFTRSVILPQGQFNRFLLLTGKDRRDMLERIFNFSKYGVNFIKKIGDRARDLKSQTGALDSGLALLGDVTAGEIESDEARLAELSAMSAALKATEAEHAVKIAEIKEILRLNNELAAARDGFNTLSARDAYIGRQRELYKKIRAAEAVKPFYDTFTGYKLQEGQTAALLTEAETAYKTAEAEASELKTAYEKLLSEKNATYPGLLTARANARQAVGLEAGLKAAENELAAFTAQITAVNGKLEAMIAEEASGKAALSALNGQLAIIARDRNDAATAPEYRQKVTEALETERRHGELSARYNDLLDKYNQRKKSADGQKKALSDYTARLAETGQHIRVFEERLASLNASFTASSLMEKKDELTRVRHTLDIFNEKSPALEKRNCELSAARAALAEKTAEEASLAAAVKRAEEAVRAYERHNMAVMLADTLADGQSCPVCGSPAHPSPARGPEEGCGVPADSSGMKAVHEQLRGDILYLKQFIETGAADAENLKKELAAIPADIGEFSRKLEAGYAALTTDTENAEKQKAETDAALKRENSLFNELSVKKARCNESLEKDAAFLTERRGELEILREQGLETENRLKDYRRELGAQTTFETAAGDILDKDRELAALNQKEEAARGEIKRLEAAINAAANNRAASERNAAGLSAARGEKQAAADEQRKRINELSPGGRPETVLNKIEEDIKNLLNGEERLKQSSETAAQQSRGTGEHRLALAERLAGIKKNAAAAEGKLNDGLTAQNLRGVSDAEPYFDMINKKSALETEITAHERALDAARVKVAELAGKMGGADGETAAETAAALETAAMDIKRQIDETGRESAVLAERIFQKKEILVKTASLKKEKEALEYQYGLHEDLLRLFAGNRFAEVLSRRQLSYITAEASMRLKTVTNGRYALELDDTNFVIRDDRNGGARRSPNTLSGGETFIVSLCLSLALSSRIQLKNNYPLEFFFLDEGFGTLDNETADTVMDALEKLRLEKLCVGLITHVDELKQRLARRLVIEPSPGGRGSVARID